MDGRTFSQIWLTLLIIFLSLVVMLISIIVWDFKCDKQIEIQRNTDLIEFLNRKFNFCYKSEIIVGDNSLECLHNKAPYRAVCDGKTCSFTFLTPKNDTL